MKNVIFWDVAPCRPCVNRRIGGTYRLHLQERGTSVSRWLQTQYQKMAFFVKISNMTSNYMFSNFGLLKTDVLFGIKLQ
jgi:hypothetical protein